MSATVEQIAQFRRMVNEPTATNYSDAELAGYIEVYPVPDAGGLWPDDDDWAPTYDLHAAAADVWEDKAAAVSEQYDFAADGGDYKRNQQFVSFMKLASYHRSRRKPAARKMRREP